MYILKVYVYSVYTSVLMTAKIKYGGGKKLKSGNKQGVKLSNKSNIIKTTICLAGIGIVIFTMVSINRDKAATVDIVKVKENVYVNQLILETNIEKYKMSKLEFDTSTNSYLTWEEKEEAVNKYATVSTKSKGYIYKGDYNTSKPIKNEWLQNIQEGNLVVSLPYVKAESFGNILTPGDRVKVNVSYTETDASGLGTNVERSKVLYEEAKVIDLLNNAGNSIYDYYTDLLALPLVERDALLRDESFLQNVSPTRILYSVTKEQGFKDYADTQGKSGVKYTYGLYPRAEGDIILDQFSDLTRQMTSSLTTGAATNSVGSSGGGN